MKNIMEIEVKARLLEKESVLNKLENLGCVFGNITKQDDAVWVKNGGTLAEFYGNDVFLRIRIEDDSRILLTAKASKSKVGNASLVKKEYEVTINSEEEAQGILASMGLQEAIRIIKKRQTAKYKDYTICIDEVTELGTFIELEAKDLEENASEIQEDMIVFLESLGISEKEHIKKGYDVLMFESRGV